MPWVLVAGTLALVLIVIAAASSTSPRATADRPANPLDQPSTQPVTSAEQPTPSEEPPLEPPAPGQIRAVTPPITDRRAAKDWEKLVKSLYEHDLGKARERLDEWERRWGESRETRYLRQQLDAIPAEPRADD